MVLYLNSDQQVYLLINNILLLALTFIFPPFGSIYCLTAICFFVVYENTNFYILHDCCEHRVSVCNICGSEQM